MTDHLNFFDWRVVRRQGVAVAGSQRGPEVDDKMVLKKFTNINWNADRDDIYEKVKD